MFSRIVIEKFFRLTRTNTCVKLCADTIDREIKMATNLAINDELIETAKKVGGHKTKKAVVTEALQEYIQRRKQLEIIDQFGKIDYDQDYDYKNQRKIK